MPHRNGHMRATVSAIEGSPADVRKILRDAVVIGTSSNPGLGVTASDNATLTRALERAAEVGGVPLLTGEREAVVTLPADAADAARQRLSELGVTVRDVPKPSIDDVNPDRGVPGSSFPLVITGSGYLGTPQVLFSDAPSGFQFRATPTRVTPTLLELNLLIPSSAPIRPYSVIVTNPDGQQARLDGGFTVQAAPPATVTSISPNVVIFDPASIDVFQTLISGTGLQGATRVEFKRGAQTILGTILAVDPGGTFIQASSPIAQYVVGFYDVVVTTPGGPVTLVGGLECRTLGPAPL